MLVLSRKAGEKIQIGDDVTLEVRRVAGNRVTIALVAPKEVRILRGELKEAATEFEVEHEAKTEPAGPAGGIVSESVAITPTLAVG